MDKYGRQVGSTDQDDAAGAAGSIRADFRDLVSMLDQQVANLAGTDDLVRAHLLEAKAAAERGFVLSTQLIELLRAAG